MKTYGLGEFLVLDDKRGRIAEMLGMSLSELPEGYVLCRQNEVVLGGKKSFSLPVAISDEEFGELKEDLRGFNFTISDWDAWRQAVADARDTRALAFFKDNPRADVFEEKARESSMSHSPMAKTWIYTYIRKEKLVEVQETVCIPGVLYREEHKNRQIQA